MPRALGHTVGWHRRGQSRELLTSQHLLGLTVLGSEHCLVGPLELDEGHPLTLDSFSLPVLCILLRCTWGSVQSSRHGVQSHSPDVCGVGEVAGPWLRRAETRVQH